MQLGLCKHRWWEGRGSWRAEGISAQGKGKEQGSPYWKVRLGAGCCKTCRLRGGFGRLREELGFGNAQESSRRDMSHLAFEQITLLTKEPPAGTLGGLHK